MILIHHFRDILQTLRNRYPEFLHPFHQYTKSLIPFNTKTRSRKPLFTKPHASNTPPAQYTAVRKHCCSIHTFYLDPVYSIHCHRETPAPQNTTTLIPSPPTHCCPRPLTSIHEHCNTPKSYTPRPLHTPPRNTKTPTHPILLGPYNILYIVLPYSLFLISIFIIHYSFSNMVYLFIEFEFVVYYVVNPVGNCVCFLRMSYLTVCF